METFTQEQLNTVASTYQNEIGRLLQDKVNNQLVILKLKQDMAVLNKKVEDLTKVSEKTNPKK